MAWSTYAGQRCAEVGNSKLCMPVGGTGGRGAGRVVSVVKVIRHKRASWLILEGSPTAAGRWKVGHDHQEQSSSLGKDTGCGNRGGCV